MVGSEWAWSRTRRCGEARAPAALLQFWRVPVESREPIVEVLKAEVGLGYCLDGPEFVLRAFLVAESSLNDIWPRYTRPVPGPPVQQQPRRKTRKPVDRG